MADLSELVSLANAWLKPHAFRDYCPNGLQIQGANEVRKIVSGVTASLALIEAAVEAEADLLLVHHGFFWKGETAEITGRKYRRIEKLIKNNLSLLAYHLPLDMHTEFGNNRRLADLFELEITGGFAEKDGASLGLLGRPKQKITLDAFAKRVADVLGREPQVIAASDASKALDVIGWCSGAAQGYFDEAIEAGAELYFSGEISEQTVHTARESGVHYLAAGHHATERYGVMALGERLAKHFGIEHQFIDIDNPV